MLAERANPRDATATTVEAKAGFMVGCPVLGVWAAVQERRAAVQHRRQCVFRRRRTAFNEPSRM
jgi:hypothetical protein